MNILEYISIISKFRAHTSLCMLCYQFAWLDLIWSYQLCQHTQPQIFNIGLVLLLLCESTILRISSRCILLRFEEQYQVEIGRLSLRQGLIYWIKESTSSHLLCSSSGLPCVGVKPGILAFDARMAVYSGDCEDRVWFVPLSNNFDIGDQTHKDCEILLLRKHWYSNFR